MPHGCSLAVPCPSPGGHSQASVGAAADSAHSLCGRGQGTSWKGCKFSPTLLCVSFWSCVDVSLILCVNLIMYMSVWSCVLVWPYFDVSLIMCVNLILCVILIICVSLILFVNLIMCQSDHICVLVWLCVSSCVSTFRGWNWEYMARPHHTVCIIFFLSFSEPSFNDL